MGKQWVRQEVKKDWLQEWLENLAIWVTSNRQLAATIAGATLAVVALAGLLLYRSHSLRNQAWDRLALAEESAYAGQVDSARKQISELVSQYPGSPAAGYALLFEGDMLYPRGLYEEAIQAYAKVLERGAPKEIQPLALGDTALAQEAAGRCQQALATAQHFLELYADHYLAPQVHASLARCEAVLGQADQARTAYQKITLQYPETSWAMWAKGRLDSIAGPAK